MATANIAGMYVKDYKVNSNFTLQLPTGNRYYKVFVDLTFHVLTFHADNYVDFGFLLSICVLLLKVSGDLPSPTRKLSLELKNRQTQQCGMVRYLVERERGEKRK